MNSALARAEVSPLTTQWGHQSSLVPSHEDSISTTEHWRSPVRTEIGLTACQAGGKQAVAGLRGLDRTGVGARSRGILQTGRRCTDLAVPSRPSASPQPGRRFGIWTAVRLATERGIAVHRIMTLTSKDAPNLRQFEVSGGSAEVMNVSLSQETLSQ